MARKFSGTQLRAARIAAGLKPEQLALHIGRSVWSIHKYEHGAAPSLAALGALAGALDCPIDDLFAEVSDAA